MQVFDGPAPKIPILDAISDPESDDWKKLEAHLVEEHEQALKDREPLQDEWTDAVTQWSARSRRKDASTLNPDS